jgi:hypothetical protein
MSTAVPPYCRLSLWPCAGILLHNSPPVLAHFWHPTNQSGPLDTKCMIHIYISCLLMWIHWSFPCNLNLYNKFIFTHKYKHIHPNKFWTNWWVSIAVMNITSLQTIKELPFLTCFNKFYHQTCRLLPLILQVLTLRSSLSYDRSIHSSEASYSHSEI